MSRTATIGDNGPPEDQVITTLVGEAEIEAACRTTVDEQRQAARTILDTYSRIPKEIADDATYEKVVTVIARLRDIDANIEEARKKEKAPYLAVNKRLDDLFKLEEKGQKLAPDIAKAIKDLTGRLSTRDTKVYQERKAEMLEEARMLTEAARKDGIEMGEMAANVEMGSVRSQHGGLSVREVVRTWKISDETKLPRSVLSVDPKKVEALLKSGASEISGLEIEESVSTVVKRG